MALQLSFVGDLPVWLATLVVVTLVCLATEITSNSVITTIFIPILAEMVSHKVSFFCVNGHVDSPVVERSPDAWSIGD